MRILLPCPSQARRTLDKNSSLSLLSRTQLLPTFPYLRDILVIVGEKNICLLAPTLTTLLPSHLTSRHPRDKEGVPCRNSEGVQEHGEGEQPHRERKGYYVQVTSNIRAKDGYKWFPTRGISSPVGKDGYNLAVVLAGFSYHLTRPFKFEPTGIRSLPPFGHFQQESLNICFMASPSYS
jgi:hypothetical protein